MPHLQQGVEETANNVRKNLVHLVHLLAEAVQDAATGVGVKEAHGEADDRVEKLTVNCVGSSDCAHHRQCDGQEQEQC